MITFYLTYGDPASWLALEPVQRLINETGVEVDCQPMMGSLGNVVTRSKPGEVDPLEAYKERRARARSGASKREMERMAELLGVPLEHLKRQVDPLNLLLGLLWLRRLGENADVCLSYSREAFKKTYVELAEVETVPAISALLKACGAATDNFPQFVADQAEVFRTRADELLESGILSAPAFVVDGEIFHGREHLPLIAWLVKEGIAKGQQGMPPV